MKADQLCTSNLMLRTGAYDLHTRHPYLQPPRYFCLRTQLLRRCRNRRTKERALIKAAGIDSAVSIALVLKGYSDQYAAVTTQPEACHF